MLTRAQEKLIRSLKTKKGRETSKRCLVEGTKLVKAAGSMIDFTFSAKDTKSFDKLVTTTTPQDVAAVAFLPSFQLADIAEVKTIIVLDGVQDPGNVGSILRLGQAFGASVLLIESADPTSPKVIRSSAGAVFHVPWLEVARPEAASLIKRMDRPVFRLEKSPQAEPIKSLSSKKPIILIAGSEGSGIKLAIPGQSIEIKHDTSLESLNVSSALAIALYVRGGTRAT